MFRRGADARRRARAIYADVKGRMDQLGRDPEHMKILPGLPGRGRRHLEEARKKRALLDSLVHVDSGIASLSIALGSDASRFDLDGPLPRHSGKQRLEERPRAHHRAARRDNLTVRSSRSRRRLWRAGDGRHPRDDRRRDGGMAPGRGSTGSTSCSRTSGRARRFVDRVVPELQRRGLFRREYEGQDPAREPGAARPAKSLFRGAGLSGAARRGRLPIRAERRAGRRRGPGGPAERDGVAGKLIVSTR